MAANAKNDHESAENEINAKKPEIKIIVEFLVNAEDDVNAFMQVDNDDFKALKVIILI